MQLTIDQVILIAAFSILAIVGFAAFVQLRYISYKEFQAKMQFVSGQRVGNSCQNCIAKETKSTSKLCERGHNGDGQNNEGDLIDNS